MAPTFVQSSGKVQQFTSTSLSKSFSSPVATGNFVLVFVFAHMIGDIFATGDVTDTAGNTYTLAIQDDSTLSPACGIFYASNVTGGSLTVTYTFGGTGNGNGWMVAEEWSGMGIPSILATIHNEGTNTTPATGSTSIVVPPDDGALVAAAMAILAATTSHTVESVSPSWAESGEHLGTGGGLNAVSPPGEANTRVVTDIGTQSCSWSVSHNGNWNAILVAFSPGAVPITGSLVAGVGTTVRVSRAIAFGLNGHANVHDDPGVFKVFGDVHITGDLTVDGDTSGGGGGGSPGGGPGEWDVVGSWTFSTNVTHVDFAITGYQDALVMCFSVTKSVSGVLGVRVSVDGGSTFLDGASDYIRMDPAGAGAAASFFGLHNTNATAARYGAMLINAVSLSGVKKPMTPINRGDFGFCDATTSPLTHVRVIPGSGGNLTGGSIVVLGR